jgi:hypothetical protein
MRLHTSNSGVEGQFSLVVADVVGGAALEWNKSQPSEQQIRSGDHIAKVNGVSETDQMFKLCKNHTVVELKVQHMSINTTEFMCTLANATTQVNALAPPTESMSSKLNGKQNGGYPAQVAPQKLTNGCVSKDPRIGTNVQALSPSNVLRPCTVIDTRRSASGEEYLKIHYHGFVDEWDEWLPITSERFQPSIKDLAPSPPSAINNGHQNIREKPLSELKQLMESLGATKEDVDKALDTDNPKQACISFITSRSSPHLGNPEDLHGKQMSELRHIMEQCGATQEDFNAALDADNPKQACINFIEQRSRKNGDLSGKSVADLRALLKALGASDDEMDKALDADDSKQAFIELITARQKGDMRAELQAEKNSDLRKKALAAGATEAEIDAALNSENVKSALINLILRR